MPNSPSVLLVEDHHVLRIGLRTALEALNCCTIVGDTDNGESAVREVQKLRPDIVLMDVGLPGIDGIEATWRIKNETPRTRVIMFTAESGAKAIMAALGAGADGYCSKNNSPDQIAMAIDTVLQGEVWLDPEIANVVSKCGLDTNQCSAAISATERRILELMQKGFGNHAIASRLKVSTATVSKVMRAMIDRFAEKNTIIDIGHQQSEQICSNEWLTAHMENVNERNIFADKYAVEKLIATGGMGAVFKAKHMYIDRYVALKLLRPQYATNRLVLRSFQREAMSIANLQHPNIVNVHDFGVTAQQEPFLVMEFIDAPALSNILAETRCLPIERIMHICSQICAGLEEAHSKGIIHCDLKPSNILVLSKPQDSVKLVDFGLAQVMPRNTSRHSKLTERTIISGTPAYMPPEQCAGKRADARSDIYALGCILYEAVTGVNIFDGPTAVSTFARHFQMIPPPMSSLNKTPVPDRLETTVSRMLAKNPNDRPQTVREVMTLLGLVAA